MHPRRNRQASLRAIGLIVALGVGGCSGGGSPSAPPTPRPAQPSAAKPAAPPVAPAPAPATAEYAYETKGRRDPFRPLILPKKAEAKVPTRPKSEREALQVNELKLAGIIWERSGAYALVETTTGRGYVLRVNDRFGEDFGVRVAKITPDAVTFELKPAIPGPQAQARLMELRLRKEE
ncbi:MAG TPA: pilus assembly protein PilP [Candidatus Methylomirabilis sp.]|nr:pilus assembly protein PilP [Candidatus Methylomirabilis sp.]